MLLYASTWRRSQTFRNECEECPWCDCKHMTLAVPGQRWPLAFHKCRKTARGRWLSLIRGTCHFIIYLLFEIPRYQLKLLTDRYTPSTGRWVGPCEPRVEPPHVPACGFGALTHADGSVPGTCSQAGALRRVSWSFPSWSHASPDQHSSSGITCIITWWVENAGAGGPCEPLWLHTTGSCRFFVSWI